MIHVFKFVERDVQFLLYIVRFLFRVNFFVKCITNLLINAKIDVQDLFFCSPGVNIKIKTFDQFYRYITFHTVF